METSFTWAKAAGSETKEAEKARREIMLQNNLEQLWLFSLTNQWSTVF